MFIQKSFIFECNLRSVSDCVILVCFFPPRPKTVKKHYITNIKIPKGEYLQLGLQSYKTVRKPLGKLLVNSSTIYMIECGATRVELKSINIRTQESL